MKKRLLSAALAFVMVLTMIPATMVTAFAVDYGPADQHNPDESSVNVKTYNKDGVATAWYYKVDDNRVTSVNVTYQAADDNSGTNRATGRWYWLYRDPTTGDQAYYYVDKGLVSGTGNSGTWYASFDDFCRDDGSVRGTSFTMLENTSVAATLTDSNTKAPTSLTIDVNGYTLTLPGTLPNKFTNLTITNRKNPLTDSGSVTAIATDRDVQAYQSGTYGNLTLTVSNTTVASINLAGNTNTVNLDNVTVTGGITMNGYTQKFTSATNSNENWYSQKIYVNRKSTSSLSTNTSFGDEITVVGDNSDLDLYNATGGVDVTITGNGGSLLVDGRSSLGDITVASRKGASVKPPAVTVTGGIVGSISRDSTSAGANESTQPNEVTINSGGHAQYILSSNGTVKVNQGRTGNIDVGAGSVDLTGAVTTGNLNLWGAGKTTLNISGTGSKIGNISAPNGNFDITGWPADRGNSFGELALGSYQGRGVKGGTFTPNTTTNELEQAGNALWFDTNLSYSVLVSAGTYALYNKDEMARAISDVTSRNSSSGAAGAAANNLPVNMKILCHGGTNTLKLMNGGILWANVGYDVPIGVILPNMINGQSIATWTSGENDASVASDREWVIPLPATGTSFTLRANDVATSVVNSITNVAMAHTPSSAAVNNRDVRVTLSGNKFTISGAVVPAPGSNIATIELDLTTDALYYGNDNSVSGGGSAPDGDHADNGATGYLVLENVQIFYNVDTRAIGFNTLQKINGGAIINDAGELVLNNGTGTHYTVSANLTQSASMLGIYTDGKEIQATIGGNLSRRTQTDKDDIIDRIAGTGAEFDINGNRAVLEAINAVQATYTSNNSVQSWITTAQNYIWKNGNSFKNATTGQPDGKGKGDGTINPHTGNLSTTGTFGSAGVQIQNLYQKAYVVPYLVVNATDLNQNGTLTATLTVYYRIDVSGSTYNPDEYYTVQAGRAMSALTGDMASKPVKVKFSNLNALSSNFGSALYMHQDGKYVYAKGATAPTVPADGGGTTTHPSYNSDTYANGWMINHAGTGSGSLGTIVLNSTPGTITLGSSIVNRFPGLVAGVSYDDLQAAIDDTVPGIVTSNSSATAETIDTVVIGGKYEPTECSITMSGVARKIAVVSDGNRKITSNTNSVEVQSNNGINYTIQLKKDNVVSGTVAVTVSANASSPTTVSRTSAKAGERVTVTVQPLNGRAPTSVTVTTNTGTVIAATPTGVPNEYTFTVPNGATSVTVTPNFQANTVTTTEATISVAGTTNGSATTSANRAKAGTTVSVNVTPSAGYRTMGISLNTNGASTNPMRQGANSFNFIVPSNTTSITVTPSFDVDNGTVFTDVWSTSYYSNAVAWAVKQGITDGQSTYLFGSSNTCTRGQMVTFLYRAAGQPSVAGLSNPFVDVVPGEYYYNAVLWAVSKGITNGVDATHFAPGRTVNRAQAVTFLYRYAGQPAASTSNGFYDVPSNEYYSRAVTWAANKGITNGTTTTTFSPSAACKRCEIVTFLYRDLTGNVA